ncbi:L,D-transpeptidase [Paenibacillus albicereus]|uniref:L,D-transpeptidase n=1 Tax=Paenibacillus albicereus TaxID=2726185 RepID=A0A6H2GVZ9_9BACL|nr:L,D-transpeptidase [Paenibacillus albicereus]QJC51601.1 L,D-transpeptidase [Paenibacillus albicereus]
MNEKERGPGAPQEAEPAAEQRLEELKRYLVSNPSNRMAWFLLGKTYAALGKEGKANYCYLRSGPIYEAYENEPHPFENLAADDWLDRWNEPRRGRIARTAARALILAAAGMALLPAASWAPGTARQAAQDAPGERPPAVSKPERQAEEKIGIVWVDGKSFAEGAAAVAAALATSGGEEQAAALTLPVTGAHYRWRSAAAGAAQASRTAGGYLLQEPEGKEGCDCESGLSPAVDEAVRREKELQEQRWSVVSGIRSYNDRYGRWPARLEELLRPYPDNVLAGRAEGMEARFAEWLQEAQEKKTAAAQGSAGGAAPEAEPGRGRLAQAMEDRYRIVVDTKSRRLALFSGPVAVRVYAAGLGGERTPLGRFEISEKVRNPNGSATGSFGSRGMTLSDTRYAIHGTDEPDSVGKDESLGCVRLGREEVEELYDLVPIGTPVTIQEGGLERLQPESGQPKKSRYRVEPAALEENPGKRYDWL